HRAAHHVCATIRRTPTATHSPYTTLFRSGGGTLGAAPPVAPANTAAPTVSGVAQQGQTLTANPGTWTGNPAPTFSYQWQRCDTTAEDRTYVAHSREKTYQLPPPDIGATVR